MKLKHSIYSICLAALVVACSNEPLPMETNETILEANLKGIANAPGQSGLYVIRNDFIVAYVFSDIKSGLTAVIGLDTAALCNGDPDWFEVVPIQMVFNPSNDIKVNSIQQGDVFCEVYRTPDEPFFLCDLLELSPLASGMAKLNYTDNDLFGNFDSTSKNAVSIKAHGHLSTLENETKRFSAGVHIIWYPNESFDFTDAVFLQHVKLN